MTKTVTVLIKNVTVLVRYKVNNIDDLIKNIEEARNKDVLDKKWEEFTGTLKKRMQGNCKMLITNSTIKNIIDDKFKIQNIRLINLFIFSLSSLLLLLLYLRKKLLVNQLYVCKKKYII